MTWIANIPFVGPIVAVVVKVLASGACWLVSQPPEVVKAVCASLGSPCQ